MKKLTNYNLPEHLNHLYGKEASSTIALAREVAVKLNELIDAFNELNADDLKWKQIQEGTIRKAVVYLKDNLLNTMQMIFDGLDHEGFVDSRIEFRIALLKARVDNLLSTIKEGSTTLDAEVIDARVGEDGTSYGSLGESVRKQFHNINPVIFLYYGITYNTETGEVTLVDDGDGGFLYTIFKRKYSGIVPATIKSGTAIYDFATKRPNAVVLNIVDGEATLKCEPLNTYVPNENDHILFLIYNYKVIPAGLREQSIIINGKPLLENPSNLKRYNGSVIGLSGKISINQEELTITLGAGYYVLPLYKTSVVSLTEQTVEYTLSGLVQYLLFDGDTDTLSIVDRFHVFKDNEFCLGCIYMGKFTPIELSMDSIVYTTANKEVITSGKTFLTMNDFFATLSNRDHTTKIVLGGDSITHGSGGTGFNQNGDLIITVSSKTYKRNPNGYCWAKLFKEFIESNFNATVTNNGCTGTYSGWWDDYKTTLIPSDTDIFILTIGTNDRNNSTLTGTTKDEVLRNYYARLTSIVDYCHNHGIQIVLCSPIPATAENEADEARLASIYELNAVVQRVASEHHMEYANLYNEVFFYLWVTGKTLESLLTDGLHPNDAMYKIMYNLYLKCFNIAPHYENLN